MRGQKETAGQAHPPVSLLAQLREECFEKQTRRNSLAVQWLGFRAFTAVGPGSIPGQGTKIPLSHVARPKK